MLLDLLILVLGLALLIGGAESLVRGSAGLARSFGVSELIIGLTIVAFGTSTPELAVNVAAALDGDSDVQFGNIVGSNICNVGLILGICALIRPLAVQQSVVLREIPMMLLASAAMLVVSLDVWIDGTAAESVNRSDGILMLLLFGVFLFYTIGDAWRERTATIATERASAAVESPAPRPPRRIGRAILLTVGGLIGLIVGGRLTVDAAVSIAGDLGVPEVIIALLLVAVGTSLPELAASGVAAYRGRTDLAVGNVVGSNIFNLLFIFGMSATMNEVTIPDGGRIDLFMMTGLAVLLLPLAFTARRISRAEGVLLLVIYLAYAVWRAGVFG